MCVHICKAEKHLRGATPWSTLWNLRFVMLKTSGEGVATYLSRGIGGCVSLFIVSSRMHTKIVPVFRVYQCTLTWRCWQKRISECRMSATPPPCTCTHVCMLLMKTGRTNDSRKHLNPSHACSHTCGVELKKEMRKFLSRICAAMASTACHVPSVQCSVLVSRQAIGREDDDQYAYTHIFPESRLPCYSVNQIAHAPR